MVTGVYQLLIHLPKDASIVVGKKGKLKFPKGYYIYTGSAQNGLKARVERHLRKKKKHFWHIDYLLNYASVLKVFMFMGDRLNECALSQKTLRKRGATVIAPKFGASDCNCPTHLVYFEKLNLKRVLSGLQS